MAMQKIRNYTMAPVFIAGVQVPPLARGFEVDGDSPGIENLMKAKVLGIDDGSPLTRQEEEAKEGAKLNEEERKAIEDQKNGVVPQSNDQAKQPVLKAGK